MTIPSQYDVLCLIYGTSDKRNQKLKLFLFLILQTIAPVNDNR